MPLSDPLLQVRRPPPDMSRRLRSWAREDVDMIRHDRVETTRPRVGIRGCGKEHVVKSLVRQCVDSRPNAERDENDDRLVVPLDGRHVSGTLADGAFFGLAFHGQNVCLLISVAARQSLALQCSQRALPLLLRRLVKASPSSVHNVRFPFSCDGSSQPRPPVPQHASSLSHGGRDCGEPLRRFYEASLRNPSTIPSSSRIFSASISGGSYRSMASLP